MNELYPYQTSHHTQLIHASDSTAIEILVVEGRDAKILIDGNPQPLPANRPVRASGRVVVEPVNSTIRYRYLTDDVVNYSHNLSKGEFVLNSSQGQVVQFKIDHADGFQRARIILFDSGAPIDFELPETSPVQVDEVFALRLEQSTVHYDFLSSHTGWITK